MRVRSKTEQNEAQYEVVDEGSAYYIGYAVGTVWAGSVSVVALSKDDYESTGEETETC